MHIFVFLYTYLYCLYGYLPSAFLSKLTSLYVQEAMRCQREFARAILPDKLASLPPAPSLRLTASLPPARSVWSGTRPPGPADQLFEARHIGSGCVPMTAAVHYGPLWGRGVCVVHVSHRRGGELRQARLSGAQGRRGAGARGRDCAGVVELDWLWLGLEEEVDLGSCLRGQVIKGQRGPVLLTL